MLLHFFYTEISNWYFFSCVSKAIRTHWERTRCRRDGRPRKTFIVSLERLTDACWDDDESAAADGSGLLSPPTAHHPLGHHLLLLLHLHLHLLQNLWGPKVKNSTGSSQRCGRNDDRRPLGQTAGKWRKKCK